MKAAISLNTRRSYTFESTGKIDIGLKSSFDFISLDLSIGLIRVIV
jgi:hypothetical protein